MVADTAQHVTSRVPHARQSRRTAPGREITNSLYWSGPKHKLPKPRPCTRWRPRTRWSRRTALREIFIGDTMGNAQTPKALKHLSMHAVGHHVLDEAIGQLGEWNSRRVYKGEARNASFHSRAPCTRWGPHTRQSRRTAQGAAPRRCGGPSPCRCPRNSLLAHRSPGRTRCR